MDFISFIDETAYLALAAGVLLEGESALLIAGIAAARGYLALPLVMLVAFGAGCIGDQICFWSGRRLGPALRTRHPALRPRVRRIQAMLRRHQLPLLLSVRFLYGLRTAVLLALGTTRISWLRFTVLNVISAAAWAGLMGGLAYAFGHALAPLINAPQEFAPWLGAALLLACSALLLAGRRRRRPALRPGAKTGSLSRDPVPARGIFPSENQ